MKKKKIIILLITLTLFISFSITTLAYFIKKIEGGTHGISPNPDDSQVIEVTNYNEFLSNIRLYDNTESEYNSDSDISEPSRRKTIKLMDNIKLKSDILVDADCHINLNDYEINLSGFNITFRYRFDGMYYIYGGIINDTSIFDEEGNLISGALPGKVIIDCPNENVNLDNLIIKENTNIKVVYATDEQIAISAMNMILSNIQDMGINDYYNIKDNVESVTHYGCDFTHNNGTMCIYTYTDLDLINNYFNYEGLEITYSSSNKEVLSDKGNVYIPSSNQTSDLTITVSYNNCEPIVKVVSVHILVKNNDYLNASNIILQKYLSRYYDSDLQALQFDTSFLLPKTNNYLGVTYTYNLTTTTDRDINSIEGTDFFDNESYDDYYLVSLSSEITGIFVTSTKGGTSITTDVIPVSGESTTVIDDNHSYAVNIARMLYNNQIFIEKDNMGYTEVENILVDPNEYGYTRIESITNRLVNNEDGTYVLIDHPELTAKGENNPKFGKYLILKYNENGLEPYVGQTVFLEITFKFKDYYDGDIVVVQVPIIYKPHTDAGQSFPAFDPFYTYFNKEFTKANSNYGYESFSMPLSYDGDKVNPIYTFVVFEKVDNAYKEEETPLFNIVYGDGNQAGFDKDTLTTVTINPNYIDINTKDYYFAYIPTYLNSSNELYYVDFYTGTTTSDINTIISKIENEHENTEQTNKHYPYISILTIPGIVRYGNNEAFFDKDFYIMAYNLLSYDTYEEGKYLLSSDLGNSINQIDFSSMSNFVLSNTDIADQINSIKGIDLMKGINVLNFEGKSLSAGDFVSELGYVSEITNLKILNLASTGIYDCTQNDFAMPNNDNNNFLETLTKLTNLEELYLQNNKIFYFSPLSEFAALKKVDISNNKFQADTWSFIEDTMTNLSNSLYGSLGANNISVVTMLGTSGVTVIKGTGNENEIQQEFLDIVNALSSLEYQDRLDENVSIDDLISVYPSGTSTDICLIYDIPQTFVLESDSKISFIFTSLTFTGNYNDFTLKISYHWEQTGLFGDSGDIEFTYEYRIARY